MKDKLKHHIFRSYSKQVGGKENLTESDYEVLAKAVNWRFELLDKLAICVRERSLSVAAYSEHVRALGAIQRQIEVPLENYQRQINEISELANLGEITQTEYENRIEALTVAILTLSLLLGTVQSPEDFNPSQLILFDAANAVLNGGLNRRIISAVDKTAVSDALDALQDPTIVEDSLDDEEVEILNDEIGIAQTAIPGLALGIYDEQYIPGELKPNIFGAEIDGPVRLSERLSMWATTALGLYAVGQLFRADDPFFEWLRDALKDSCTDCLRLDEQVHTAEEWKDSGWYPKSRGLECNGYKCGCIFIEAQGPSSGDF